VVVDEQDPAGHGCLIGMSRAADEGEVEPARSDTYTSWLVGLTFIVLALGAATGFFVANPSLQSAYALPEARLVLETVVALAAAAVAVLAATRFSVEGQRIDLLLCAGFAATAVGGIVFEIVPALGGDALGPIEAWAGLLARLTAAVLVAAAAFAPGRVVERRRSLVAAGAGLATALGTGWAVLHIYGVSLQVVEPVEGERPLVLALMLAVVALLTLVAAVGFGLRFRRERRSMDSWLAVALMLLVFADLHYVLTPSLTSEFLLQGDFLRVLAYGVLLVAVWRAIRAAEFGHAVSEERARVAREIHDGLAQYLFAISTHVSMLGSGASLDVTLPKLQLAAEEAQQEAKFAVLALSSASGTASFDAALRRYVDFLTADGVLDVDLEIEPDVRLAPDEQIEVFRIVQEGLANVRKHAGARHADVLIGERDGRRVVRVHDDGIGFEGGEAPAGQGLKNMRRRAESIEGGFSLSSRPGRGTALEIVLRV
jgi:signal transduction histidine kinase